MINALIAGMEYGILAVGCLFVLLLGCLVGSALVGVINAIGDALKREEE